jgi:tetratricopeptide (TPR) repeat protein
MKPGRDQPPSTAPDQAMFLRALALHQEGKLNEAERRFEKIVRREPDNFAALHLLGVISLQTKRFERGAELIAKSIALHPNDAFAHRNLGFALSHLKRFEAALASFDKAIALNPRLADAYCNRGIALNALKRYEDALASCDRAIALDPAYAEAHHNRGLVLNELMRHEEGLASLDKALAINPQSPGAHYDRGTILAELARFEDASASYDRAVALKADFADAYWNKSLCTLRKGKFGEGWPLYEWRKKTPQPAGLRIFSQPEWLGVGDLTGKILFVHAEQGLGDTIQFCRYAPLTESLGAKVILSVQDGLVRLLRTLSPTLEVVDSKTVPTHFDYHVALLSMPLAFRTIDDNIPHEVPYLRAEPDRVRKWRDALGTGGVKIGICWQGNKRASADAGRSFLLSQFRGVSMIPGVRLISLQKSDGAEQLTDLPAGMNVEILGDGLDSGTDAFLDTAAVMESLDLVITADTAIAHLGGALARPTWVALKHVADWRWQLERDDSPWYPTMRLFRQARRDDWKSAFDDMERTLRAQIGAT